MEMTTNAIKKHLDLLEELEFVPIVETATTYG